MLFPTTRISKDPGRPNTESLWSALPGGSGVMDGRDCTRPVVVGSVDVRHCVPVRDVSRSAETGASPHCWGVLFNSHTITVLIMLTWLRWWIMFILNTYRLIEVIFHHITLSIFTAKNRTYGDISSLSFSLSLSLCHPLPLSLFAIILGIKCHCFDTIAQTQKWFLKGDRAISRLLDLRGWRGPACLSEQKKGGDDRV